MKHYTSIEQSKKLLELGLNPNTADMCYHGHCSPLASERVFDEEPSAYSSNNPNWDYPCWSLGALLNILPSATLDSSDDHYYRLQCMGRSTEWYDSAVDACVDMIEKLHEQNLL